jgi:hypothetical protein
MTASESFVRRLRVKRAAAVGVVVLALVSLGATAYGLHVRSSLRARYADRIRHVAADVASLELAVRSDVSALANAFDDQEVASVLAEQNAMWADRARRCSALREELATLVPDSSEQTEKQMELEASVVRMASVSAAMTRSAATNDLDSARGATEMFDE